MLSRTVGVVGVGAGLVTVAADSADAALLVDGARRRTDVITATMIAINNANPPRPPTMPPISRLVEFESAFELSFAAIGVVDVEFVCDSTIVVSMIVVCDSIGAAVVVLVVVVSSVGKVNVLVTVSAMIDASTAQFLRMFTHSQVPSAVDAEPQSRQFVSASRSVCSEQVTKFPENAGTSPDNRFA